MRVAIFGCGYVGLELCRQLSAEGDEVVGLRRSPDGVDAIEAGGGTGVRGDLTESESLDGIPTVDALVFAASTGGGGPAAARELYVQGLEGVLEHFASRAEPPERLVFTSSTGVYGDHDGDWVDEETAIDPVTEKTRVLAAAEETVLTAGSRYGIDGTVARLAGLYGPDRYRLERYLEGPVTEGYLNMVHRDDAAGVIGFLLDEDRARGEVVLVVDDEPVEKWTFADWLAERCSVDRPPKRTTAERLEAGDLSKPARRRLTTSKRCSNENVRSMGYSFRYPTFREGYEPRVRDCISD